MKRIRVVPDTNVVVSAVLRPDGLQACVVDFGIWSRSWPPRFAGLDRSHVNQLLPFRPTVRFWSSHNTG